METYCDINVIKEKIFEILEKRFELDRNTFSEEFCDKELLGTSIGLKARDLIYLYFDIENEFEISVPEEEIINTRFNTTNNIIDIVHKQLNKKIQSDLKVVI